MHGGKYGLGLKTLDFLFLAGKSTTHMWEREVVIEGINHTSGANRT
jgi:hypothetical protein